jgi:hypothetical protein
MTSSSRSFPSVAGRGCKLPAPPNDGIIATTCEVAGLPIEELVELTAELYPRASAIDSALARKGIATDHLGLGWISSVNLIHEDRSRSRFLIFGPKLQLSECGASIVASLREEGIYVNQGELRVVWGMPVGWDPNDTMEEFSAHVFRGCVAEDFRLLGVPVKTGKANWAYWLGVHVANLAGEPAVIPMPFAK